MLKIEQRFGAKIITNTNKAKSLSYVVFLKKQINRENKISLFNNIKQIVKQNIWTNENIDYIVVELNFKQKKFINNLSSVAYIGEVNIDLENLKKIMKGESFYLS